MPRPKSLGPFAPLSATYFDDDAVIDAGERAEVLFTRSLAFSSRSSADGFISDRQLTILGRGLPGMPKRVATLVETGLWIRVDGGYLVRAWLKWNKSAEEIGRALKLDRERKSSQRGLFGNEGVE